VFKNIESRAVALDNFRIIDLRNTLARYIAYGRGKLPAGMNLPIGKNSNEIEGCPAAEASTTAKWLSSFPIAGFAGCSFWTPPASGFVPLKAVAFVPQPDTIRAEPGVREAMQSPARNVLS